VTPQTAAHALLRAIEKWRSESEGRLPGEFALDFGRSGARFDPGPYLSRVAINAVASLGPVASPHAEALRSWANACGIDAESEPVSALGFLHALANEGPAETLKRYTVAPTIKTPVKRVKYLITRRPADSLLKILKILIRNERAMPDKGIAKAAGIGLPTARRPLRALRKDNYLLESEEGWKLTSAGRKYAEEMVKEWP
jgi:hypothetical protein